MSNSFDKWWRENGIECASYAEKVAAKKGWNAAMQRAAEVSRRCSDEAVQGGEYSCNCAEAIEQEQEK